jgi:type IV secretory pathway TrbL component
MSLDLATVKASLGHNKVALGVGGAVVVGALALRARNKTAAGVPAAAPLAAGTSASPSTSAGYSTGTGGYNSSASDVYSAIQPQLESVGQSVAQLKAMLGQSQTPPIPVPAAPAAAAGSTDPRQAAIQADYTTFLGRSGGQSEINFWDATGQSLDAIRSQIVGSPEAQGKK